MSEILIKSGTETFKIDKSAGEKSKYITGMLNCSNNSISTPNSIKTVEIQITDVATPTLKTVLEWCDHYKSSPGSINEDDNSTDMISPWDRKFLNVDSDTLRSIILAANFLGIEPLLNAACKLAAEMLRGRQPQEIIDAFNAIQ